MNKIFRRLIKYMYGAILGDIIGSPYERSGGDKTTDFPLFSKRCRYTDDTVMTFAVCQALLASPLSSSSDIITEKLNYFCQKWGQTYPNAGFGGSFIQWIFLVKPTPYNSWGNGSAMRVSSVGWLYDDITRTRIVARLSAAITHNHIEGIKGAESVASAIFLARTGKSKSEIKEYIETEFGYDLSRKVCDIRPNYHFDVSCQGSVPESIICFLESTSFEEAIRLAVSLGGDTDTMGAIAGSIAEAYYGVPLELKERCEEYMTPLMKSVMEKFEENKKERIKRNDEN